MPVDRLRGRALQTQRERYRQEQPLCVRCLAKGKVTEWTELDHIHAIGKGGDKHGEVQGLCKPCHAEKTAADFGHTYKPKRKIGITGYPED